MPSNADVMFSWHSSKQTMEARLEMDGTIHEHQSALAFKYDKVKGKNCYVGDVSEIKLRKLQDKRQAEQAELLRYLPKDEATAETWSQIGDRMLKAGLVTTNNDSIRTKLQTVVNDGLCVVKGKGVKGDPTLYFISDKGLDMIIRLDATGG